MVTGGFILDVKSARKIENENRKVWCVNLFPLVEQESSRGRQMDRGKVEVEEERQARVKSAPVLPTERETFTKLRMRRFAAGARRVWQDVRQKIPTNASVTMDYGFLGRDTDVDLATTMVLIQRPHGAVGACQVLRKGPEPYAIDSVLATPKD